MEDTTVIREGYIPFTILHAFFLAGSIITYLVDLTIDVILAATYASDGYYWYALITVCLVVGPTIMVQIFSVRWHYMDEVMNKAIMIIHSCLLGVLHRYLVVITLGLEAMRSGEDIDYERYYRQQSDVCMLRLFDSFLESAPQLVFHLYVMFVKSNWPAHQAIWTGLSAATSMVSLGWGIAAYSSSQRMVRTEKGKMTWTGMILQTVWRFGMLSARIIALVMLSVALNEWSLVVIVVHWLLMTIWVILQETDFCTNAWEERLYNAIVGVIYCFCFFNLKEGQSRFRAAAFYLVIIVENYVFVATFCYTSNFDTHPLRESYTIGAFAVVTVGTIVGLSAMLLYYRYFHPVGPIVPCGSVDVEKTAEIEDFRNSSTGPDFTIDESLYRHRQAGASPNGKSPPTRPTRKHRVQYSRSFKVACPPVNRFTPKVPLHKHSEQASPESIGHNHERLDSAYGTDSYRTASRSTASPSADSPVAPVLQSPEMREDVEPEANNSNESGAFNNDTYMSVDSPSPTQVRTSKSGMINSVYQAVKRQRKNSSCEMSQCSQTSADSRVTVIERTQRASSEDKAEKKPLKRSPVLKDVTDSPPLDAKGQRVPRPKIDESKLTGPLTIIIPNISHQAFARSSHALSDSVSEKTIALDVLNPEMDTPNKANPQMPFHDYENLALININRAPIGGITHWRTYSDMANNKHDESTAYEKKNGSNSDYSNFGSLQYYDIHPLSTELKEQLYRSLTPLSTAATMASDTSNNVSDSDTYEPIEAAEGYFSQGAANSYQPNKWKLPTDKNGSSNSVTLIHHDGQRVSTQQILSLDNLKEVLKSHHQVPMDELQDRGDLYLLAPMRILSPILEESEHGEYSTHHRLGSEVYQSLDLNRSIMTVLSEVLSSKGGGAQSYNPRMAEQSLMQRTTEETTSSLVHTIEEIRNNSLCNLFFSSFTDTPPKVTKQGSESSAKPNNNGAAPQVPPRNNSTLALTKAASKQPLRETEGSQESAMNYFKPIQKHEDKSSEPVDIYQAASSLKSVRSNTLVPSPMQSRVSIKPQPIKPIPTPSFVRGTPLSSSSAGTRKNILELAGSETTNTILNTPKKVAHGPHLKVSSSAALHPPARETASLSMSLSPSSKYETPTPPLRPHQFVRNISSRPRRKFSIIRDSYEVQNTGGKQHPTNSDLYENISDDLLHNDLSQISRLSISTPSIHENKELRPDEKYENLQRGWATSSIRFGGQTSTRDWCLRNNHNRRSMSILEDKENFTPPALRRAKYPSPKPSLSPNAKIFAKK
eukprot:maker-scaffold284_size223161-snap-gene-1.25 protein:Tk12314 transcript:maker-scaffold284_size223161-snap-gene-1.25-mRNA-1 annotation:"xk-related protein 6"